MSKTLTYRTIQSSAVLFTAVIAMCFMSQSASAQSCGYGGGVSIAIGSRGYGGYGGGYNRGIGYSSYRPSYSRARFHNTSHYDYHPGQYVRHGNHTDYVRGHYDFHRTGHWHR